MAARRTAIGKARTQAESRRLNPLVEFVWQGRDKRGVVMKGEQLAKNANQLRAELRKQGITPTVVKTKPKPLFGGAKTITPRDIAVFSRQLATMMKSGVPIVMALEIIAGGNKNQTMKKMVNGLKNDIEGGASISEALARYPVQFDELFRNLVAAGESSGVLETVLETIATYKENIESIKGKIKKALYYPATVIAVAIIVCGILLVFVVPTFRETFVSFGADLPAFTKLVFGISDQVVKWWWLIAIAVVAGGLHLPVLLQALGPAAALHRSDDVEAPDHWPSAAQLRGCPLRAHLGGHVCRRRTAGGGVGQRGRRHRQYRL